jgi:hypothetical protein
MPTSDDRFVRLEKFIKSQWEEMRAGFLDMRSELRAELQEDMRAGFKEMRGELQEDMRAGFKEMRAELQGDMRAGFQDMRSDLRAELQSEIRTAVRTEMAPAFGAVNKRLDGLSAQFVEFRRDFVGRVDMLANYVHLTDQGYLKMSDRLSILEQRVDRIESASIFQSTQS